MALTVEQAEDLLFEVQRYDSSAELMEQYSGRAMYGDTVPAFTGDREIASAVAFACAMNDIPWKDVPKRTDSMGMGVVVY